MNQPWTTYSQVTKLWVTLMIISSNCYCLAAMDPWPTINSSPQHFYPVNSGVSNMDNDIRTSSHSKIISNCTCKFFIWDAWSYFKYREITSQLNRNTYEGLGGRKFVRAQPGSVLEKWYPQLRKGALKKDGCLLCGYSFTDHLEFWSKCKQIRGQGRVSCFFRYLESTSSNLKCHPERSVSAMDQSFHQQYVEECSNDTQRSKRRGKELKRTFDGNVSYLVPPFNPSADGKPKKLWTVLILAMARTAALARVDDLIWFDKVASLQKEHEQ
ncbi:hypothetical protein HJC23_004300 [Cyclotella cryptica]|uniref:Uncharacterized protein n=1 Tax=Cyclotella cryptica TaxID=29204 RepID=A0ABD3Q3I8_9STRA